MRPGLAIAAVLFLAVPFVAAQTPTPTPSPFDRTVVLTVPGMDGVRVRRDVVYETVGEMPMKADVYLPARASRRGPYPGVVLVAGGAENTKDWGIYRSLGRLFAASGFAAVPFNHRLRYPRRQYEEGAADLLALVSHLRANAASLEVDPERIAMMVFSGGGPMLSVPMRERIPGVRCLVNYYAFLDTDHVDLAEAGITREGAEKFSPLRQFTANPPALLPLFIARAGKDAIPGVNASIDRFVAAALERNAPVLVVNHPEGEHGFDHRNSDARSREILKLTIEFLREQLTR
ncbi:MAG TPA: alpha/beta hydrolase [Thermoanaerobaculia bacterium]|nr:alpha/beta hydrolase [Thermoanaerobaculia bacterium]